MKEIFFKRNKYGFSFREKLLGAKILHFGYQKQEDFDIIENDRDLVFKALKEEAVFYLPKNFFKPLELEYIWAEIFTSSHANPHSYERDDIKIDEGDLVLDAGACEGFFTYYALKKKASRILAIEPEAQLADFLRKTYAQDERVEVLDYALSERIGNGRLMNNNEYGCISHLDEHGSLEIKTTSVDAMITKLGLERLDFIKMDIEDEEVKAIKGATETLRKFRPKLSIAVYHSYENAIQIKQFIKRHAPKYKVWFGGCYLHEKPARPYMLYAVPES